jgi:hypothetical protein
MDEAGTTTDLHFCANFKIAFLKCYIRLATLNALGTAALTVALLQLLG